MTDEKIPISRYGATSTSSVTSPSDAVPTPVSVTVSLRPGYDNDPYDSPEERAEGFFIGKLIGKFTGETDGFCSTYREWHIFVQGLYAGFRAPQLGDVPECPPLWSDESQYFEGAAMVANVAKIYGSSAIATLAGAVLALKSAGIA